MRKNYNSKFLNGLVEKMKRGTVTFKVKRYMPDDLYEQYPYVCKVRGTLVNYEKEFGRPYSHQAQNSFLLYWSPELDEWRTARCKNLINPAEE